MSGDKKVRYFLGANSAEGFVSLYDRLTDPNTADHIWYIKGGPGNGKSTFMRKTAEAAEKRGFHTEYILCSGDPKSLDGIYIRELRTAYVDATAPHVQEPALPGITGRYIDLSSFYKKTASPDPEKVRRLFRAYKSRYQRAYDHLKAAALTSPARIPEIAAAADTEKLTSTVAAFAGELLHKEGPGFAQKDIFLSANTGEGVLRCTETAACAGRIIRVFSAFGLVDPFLRCFTEECRRRRLPVILCHDPLLPERLEGLMIPDAGISLLSCSRTDRGTIKLDSLIDEACLLAAGAEIKRCRTAAGDQMKLAERSLAEASRMHDELEAEYHSSVDFAALSKFTEKHIKEFISGV